MRPYIAGTGQYALRHSWQPGGGLLSSSDVYHRRLSVVPSAAASAASAMASGDGASSSEARVVTYNVLSSHLAEETYFTHCAPEDLNAETRLQRVIEKLEPELAKGAVVGLQEVSMTWAGPLTTWFASRGYHLVLHLYGKPFNNYMAGGGDVHVDISFTPR